MNRTLVCSQRLLFSSPVSVEVVLECIHYWCCRDLCRELVPCSYHSVCEELAPWFQITSPHFQLQAVSPCPVSLTELEELVVIYCYFVCQQLIRFNQVTSS